MTTLISKRHKQKFYLTVIFGTIAFVVMGTAMLLSAFKAAPDSASQAKSSLMTFAGIAIYLLAAYTIYRYYKNAPVIKIDKTSIRIGRETFAWSELESVELTGKKPFPYIIGFSMEALTLQFKSGQIKYLFDDMYENAWEIKLFIQSVGIDHKEFKEKIIKPVSSSETDSDYFETFSGSQITSLRGISLWSVIGFFMYSIFTSHNGISAGLIVIFILFSFFWFLLHSWLMHYFKLSDRYFLVKNQNLFWRTTAYRLTDIYEIAFETAQKRPNCLRVITKDFKSKLYPAATLRDKTWLALKNSLEEHDIKVRSEIYLGS